VPSGRDVHRAATRLLSVVMVLVGVALVVATLTRGGGPLAVGVVFGLLFVAAGVARLVLERGRERS
jgi:prolipoprotein diacylglyceryltransferase